MQPVLIPCEAGGAGCSVCWYRANDGVCHGHVFYKTLPSRMQRRFDAIVRQVSMTGVLKDPHGHRLHDDFRDLWEFTPHKYRLIAFMDDRMFIVTNGGKKESEKRQTRDYRRGLELRAEYYAAQRFQSNL